MSLDGFNVRLADEPDITYVMALQRANRESVGGLAKPAVMERISRRTLAIGTLNGDPCGYLLFDVRDKTMRIPQACIQYDARRRKYGEALVRWLMEHYPADEIRLRCAADIEANVFWRDMGFTCTSVVQGGRRRGRLINCWAMWLAPRLIGVEEIATMPAVQVRVDSMYDNSGFMRGDVEGFRPVTKLPKLAWSNRKRKDAMTEMPYKRNGCDLCGRVAPLSRIELAPGNREKLARVAYVCDQHPVERASTPSVVVKGDISRLKAQLDTLF